MKRAQFPRKKWFHVKIREIDFSLVLGNDFTKISCNLPLEVIRAPKSCFALSKVWRFSDFSGDFLGDLEITPDACWDVPCLFGDSIKCVVLDGLKNEKKLKK